VLSALLAIVAGTAVGLFRGGSFRRLRSLRLRLAGVGVVGLVAAATSTRLDSPGTLSVSIEAVATAGLLAFAIANIRLGGMVVVLAGLCIGLVPADRVGAVGDPVINVGLALVAASALRCRTVRREAVCDYVSKIAPLGQGPVDPSGPRSHVRRIGSQGIAAPANGHTALNALPPEAARHW